MLVKIGKSGTFDLAPTLRLAALAATLLLTTTAWAEEANEGSRTEARAMFDRGMAAVEQGDVGAAVRAFEASYRLYAHPGTLANLAEFQERAGRALAAHRSWQELLDRFGTVISDDARTNAQERLRRLETSLAQVVVSTAPEGASVLIDGRDSGRTPFSRSFWLEPGEHTFESRLEAHETATETRMLSIGDNEPVELVLAADISRAGPPRLTVESSAEGAVVYVDEEEAGAAPITREVEAGQHSVRVVAPGHIEQTRVVRVDAGEGATVIMDLVPEPGAGDRRGFWRGPWPWVIGATLILGAGALGLGLGLRQDDVPSTDWDLTMR